jgi:signal transduction histidine kinase
MSQIQDGHTVLDLEPGNVSDLLEGTLVSAREAAPGRSVELVAVSDGVIPPLRFDRIRLGVAVTHLLTNGIRFTPDGGQVEVRARWDGAALEIAVRDNGIGIPSERQARLFEKGGVAHDVRNHHSSATLEFNSAGLGLGLSIARGIIEAHGGTLQLESEPGNGSTFRMRLPLDPAEALDRAA